MYVGNIVIDSKIEEENFNICSDLDTIDNDLPTLIIGWELTKNIVGDDISILHKKINQRLYWTFNQKERKVDYEVDFEKFKEICFNTVDLNVIEYTTLKKEKIINKVKNLNNNILVSNEIFNKCKDLLYKIKFNNKLIPYIYKNGEFG